MEKTYESLTPKQKFLEHVLEVLHESLMSETLPKAKHSFEQLKLMVSEADSEELTESFSNCKMLWEQFLEKFEGSDINSFSDAYNQKLAQFRDELFKAHQIYEAL